MNKLKWIVLLIGFLGTVVQAQKKPNVIVILADDLGVGDISSYRRLHTNQIILETPNIDKLSAEGVQFTNAHAPAALCATSRYSIMTGLNCYRSPLPWGVWSAYSKSVIDANQLTLPRLMKQANYATAFFGKWHMGTSFAEKGKPNSVYESSKNEIDTNVDISKIIDGGPTQIGFDYSVTLPAGIQSVPYAIYENDAWLPLKSTSKIQLIDEAFMSAIGIELEKKPGYGDSNWSPKEIGPLLVSKAVSYIAENAKKKEPFFMYYCSQAVHTPHTPIDELNGVKIAGTTPSKHMDMIKELDVQVGMLINELKKQGVNENTVIIFTSDNGGLHVDGETWNAHHEPSDIYRGAKNDPYEGGHRVPFIVSWPSKIKGNQQQNIPVLGLDIMATIASISGQKHYEKQKMLDSYNLLPVVLNEKDASNRPFLMVQGGSQKEVMIIEDNWKLIIQVDKKDKTDMTRTPVALFDLATNPTEDEQLNLIHEINHKNKVLNLLNTYNKARDGKLPTVN